MQVHAECFCSLFKSNFANKTVTDIRFDTEFLYKFLVVPYVVNTLLFYTRQLSITLSYSKNKSYRNFIIIKINDGVLKNSHIY